MSERIQKTRVTTRIAELEQAERELREQLRIVLTLQAEFRALLKPDAPIITHGETAAPALPEAPA